MSVAIRLDDVTVSFDRHPAIHHVSGEFAPGSLTAVVGPNGAGKTTLLRAIVGALPASGRIDLRGIERRSIAYLPQQAEIDRSFPIAALDLVALGHWRRRGPFGALRGADIDAAAHALDAVGLRGFERRPIGTLSAGQFQRALFARTLVQDAPIVLLDEPFAAIDARTAADLLALVRRWNGERRTVVCVLHDFEQVRSNFPSALLLAREAIAWGPTAEALAPANLLRARAMAESWDDRAESCARVDAA